MYPEGPFRWSCSLRMSAAIIVFITSCFCLCGILYFGKPIFWPHDNLVVKIVAERETKSVQDVAGKLTNHMAQTLLILCRSYINANEAVKCIADWKNLMSQLSNTHAIMMKVLVDDIQDDIETKHWKLCIAGLILNAIFVVTAIFCILGITHYRGRMMVAWLVFAGVALLFNWAYILGCCGEAVGTWSAGWTVLFVILGIGLFALTAVLIFTVALYFGYLYTMEVFREDENKMQIIISTV